MNILNDDLLDEGLQAVMGKERCQNPEDWRKDLKKHKSAETEIDASWVPVRESNAMDKVKECAKWALGFAAVGAILFYWQLSGLLDPRAAVPSLIAVALGAGLTVGWHAR